MIDRGTGSPEVEAEADAPHWGSGRAKPPYFAVPNELIPTHDSGELLLHMILWKHVDELSTEVADGEGYYHE